METELYTVIFESPRENVDGQLRVEAKATRHGIVLLETVRAFFRPLGDTVKVIPIQLSLIQMFALAVKLEKVFHKNFPEAIQKINE